MEIEIHNEESETKGSYYVEIDGNRVAEMTYSVAGSDRIIIDHTEVGDAQRGTGLGEKLVYRAVKDARNKGISIVPLCPFARSVFNKNVDLKDVL
ncbi:GNAT family N-acetyltransferase [Ekhidna sp.]|uniref:GNAT family N-acetyltransferase n=1 Tax=Ekhidna sp. TaxID=2608089 RepID=UPI00329A43D1